jgi:hypothetical protein
MIIRGKLIAESPLYRGNARKTLFTRDGDGSQRLVSLAGEISGTAQALMDAFIGQSRDGRNIGLLNRAWQRLYGAALPDGLITRVDCRLPEAVYTQDHFFDLRMGLKLDEDRWAAEANANYKMETVFRDAAFDFSMMVNDATLERGENRARLYYLLQELCEGRFWFGAGKSKGLGRVRLEAALGAPFAGAGLADAPEAASPLWKEIRQAGTGIGFAVPCGWEVGEMPAEGGIRSQTLRSYDEAFFAAHSEKGDWKGGVWPEGAYKLDLTLVESVDPGLSTFEAYSRLVDASLESLSGGEEVQLGANTWTEVMVKSALHPEQPATKVYVYRLAPERLLIAAAYPLGTAIDSPDVQAILASMVMSSEQAVILPQAAPQHQLNSAACAP